MKSIYRELIQLVDILLINFNGKIMVREGKVKTEKYLGSGSICNY